MEIHSPLGPRLTKQSEHVRETFDPSWSNSLEALYAELPIYLPVSHTDGVSVILDFLGQQLFTYERRQTTLIVSLNLSMAS